MSNQPGRRPRGGLHLPRSAWPIMLAFGATPGRDDAQVEEAIRAATARLASRLTGATRRSEIRALTVDADDCAVVLDDLNVPPDAHGDVRAFCAAHPAGRLIVAWCDYQPNTRRTTVLGG